ncbi:methyltransferase [Candidatus Woesearchaeota archaeon]|nr:methyltransferase [Candidatus Woesearchaeota archaeon]
MYEPQEDSFLLQKAVKREAFGKVLDIGAGSGIQAITAAEKIEVKSVLAVDIQKSVIDFCEKKYSFERKEFEKEKIKVEKEEKDRKEIERDEKSKNIEQNKNLKKITWLQSNLFQKIKKIRLLKNRKFDTIIINPPYLPQDPGIKDRTLYGGKKGYELIEKIFKDVNNYLSENGIILLLFSSLTNKKKVEEIIFQQAMQFEEVEKLHIDFEDLYVYKIQKSEIRKVLEKKKFEQIAYFAKGKRGILYSAIKNKKRYVIKTKHPESKAQNTIENEARWLKKLNKYNIGPKYKEHGPYCVIYEYAPGIFIEEWIEKSKKREILKMVIACIRQCRTMDVLKMDKEEMHNPFKHIVIQDKPVFLDFERARYTLTPKNVTQFCQYLSAEKIQVPLRKKGIELNKEKIRNFAQEYKQDYDQKTFNKIVTFLKNS